jgi:glycosyltransferase involved in cell wall biosynthesis
MLPRSRTAPVFGFIGNYGHPPNQEALRWLSEGLAEAIRERCPDARFVLAGKGIPAWARNEFGGRSYVELREDVPDLRDFYAGVTAFLNPIRSGRGMRTKIVEAAAFGRPIATTSLGAEGLENLALRIGDGTRGLAEACAALLADPDPEAAIRRNRDTVEREYSLGKVAGELLTFIGPP